MSEINITLFHPPTSKTDAISIPTSTTLSDLSNFAMALLGLDGDGVVLAKGQSRTAFYNPSSTSGEGGSSNTTLATVGVGDGEFISVYRVTEFASMNTNTSSGVSPARQRQRTTNAPATSNSSSGGGGLDFSSLLGNAAAAPAPAAAAAGGMMDFTALLSAGSAAAAPTAASSSASTPATQPVQWDKMTLDDAIHRSE